MEFAIGWARNESTIESIDLDFLGGNLPAEALYLSAGFVRIGAIEDMFRMDGRSIDSVLMALRIR